MRVMVTLNLYGIYSPKLVVILYFYHPMGKVLQDRA